MHLDSVKTLIRGLIITTAAILVAVIVIGVFEGYMARKSLKAQKTFYQDSKELTEARNKATLEHNTKVEEILKGTACK